MILAGDSTTTGLIGAFLGIGAFLASAIKPAASVSLSGNTFLDLPGVCLDTEPPNAVTLDSRSLMGIDPDSVSLTDIDLDLPSLSRRDMAKLSLTGIELDLLSLSGIDLAKCSPDTPVAVMGVSDNLETAETGVAVLRLTGLSTSTSREPRLPKLA
ncbi:DNA polymerase alpha subunit, putative [Babesia ovis]|uniref:DNA polymerase alpha subunit, putative n=1 Tax=Babesia ovis TaxID=5869 RepID=A0A9W5WVR9_BABOV|nr:DNA polymerase alpha subunit, putative [Babesia ovis]